MKKDQNYLNLYIFYIQELIKKMLQLNSVYLISGLADIILERWLLSSDYQQQSLIIIDDYNHLARNVLLNYQIPFKHCKDMSEIKPYDKDYLIIINSKNIPLINQALDMLPTNQLIIFNLNLLYGTKNDKLKLLKLGIGELPYTKSFYTTDKLIIDDFDTTIKRSYLAIINLFNYFIETM